MIYTVTLNPAVDKTIKVNHFSINQVNRAADIREDAGGKGINVSKMINNLQGKSIAFGICGGTTGEFILNQMDRMDIEHLFIRDKGNTRTNIKIVDEINNTYTDINEQGCAVSEAGLKALEELIFTKVTKDDILVLAGSVPLNVSKDIYMKWIQMANKIGTKVILDADKELLEEGVKAGPFMIKPNINELGMLFKQNIETVDKAIKLSKTLFKYGINMILISRGEDGCVIVTPEKTLCIEGLKVPVKSTVGAGDSMVAAMAYALNKHDFLEEAAILAVAASSASVMQEGTIMGDLSNIKQLMKQVNIKRWENDYENKSC